MVSDMKKAKTRPYAMAARAEAASATRARILASTRKLLAEHSFDEMTLDAIAAGAGTTVRTVLRIFGGKELLFAAALETLDDRGFGPVRPGDVDATLASVYDIYERIGDTVIRWLADEPRLPAMREHINFGRANLRGWVSESFAPSLAGLAEASRSRLLNALIVALDVYVWKLLRRDFGLDSAAARAVVRSLLTGLIGENERG
jgi:AcrR family transcriptional regulator